jgi:hypothetical protein
MQSSVLFQAFQNVSGASFVGLDTETRPSLKGGKKNPMQGRVTKKMTGASIMVFQNKNVNGYENMVRRRLEAEGKNPDTFKLGERAWGTRVENLPIVEHKGQHYMEVIFLKPGKVEFFLDGSPIARDLVQGLDDDKPEGDQGGLNAKVIIRTFAADSITAIRVDGQVFQ